MSSVPIYDAFDNLIDEFNSHGSNKDYFLHNTYRSNRPAVTPQGDGFSSRGFTPVTSDPAIQQRILKAHIAEAKVSKYVTLLFNMVIETDDDRGKVVPGVKVVVNTSTATYYQTDIVSHGGTISSYDDDERKSGIQVYHRVDPVKEERFVFVIDWIVKSIYVVIKMSDKLLLRFKKFIEKYKNEGDYVFI
jgi:hypothetical protein